MLVCHGCHRHVRVHEIGCPFCGASNPTTTAPPPVKLGAMALVVGLGLLGCGEPTGGSNETTSSGETASTTDSTSMTTIDDEDEFSAAADYGGPDEWQEEEEEGDGDGDWEESESESGDGESESGDGDGDMTGDGDGDDEGGADYGGAPRLPTPPQSSVPSQ